MELFWSILRVLALVYAGLVLLLFFTQATLIFPGSAVRHSGAARTALPGCEQLSLRTGSGDQVAAWFGPALSPAGERLPDAAARPTLIYFYGNGSSLSYCDWEFERFRRLGANVLIPDYVGYGMSTGAAGEAGCYATADAAYDHLISRKDVDPSRIVATGQSLGGAVAIDLAARRPVAALATFCTFSSLTEMAGRQYPFVPVPLLLRHRFESLSKIPRIRCPILIAHGRQDTLIPYAMSDRLAAAAAGPVTRLCIEDAGHNDLFTTGETEVLTTLGRFLERLSPGLEGERR